MFLTNSDAEQDDHAMSSSTELHDPPTAAEEAVEAAISPPDLTALAEELVEMADHLGNDRHDAAGRGSGNSRNGTSGR